MPYPITWPSMVKLNQNTQPQWVKHSPSSLPAHALVQPPPPTSGVDWSAVCFTLPHPSDPPLLAAPLRAAPEVPDGAPEAPFWPSPHSSKLRDGIHQHALQLPLQLSSPSWLHASYCMYWLSGASIPGNTQGINFGLPGQLPQEYSARMHYAQTSSK